MFKLQDKTFHIWIKSKLFRLFHLWAFSLLFKNCLMNVKLFWCIFNEYLKTKLQISHLPLGLCITKFWWVMKKCSTPPSQVRALLDLVYLSNSKIKILFFNWNREIRKWLHRDIGAKAHRYIGTYIHRDIGI